MESVVFGLSFAEGQEVLLKLRKRTELSTYAIGDLTGHRVL